MTTESQSNKNNNNIHLGKPQTKPNQSKKTYTKSCFPNMQKCVCFISLYVSVMTCKKKKHTEKIISFFFRFAAFNKTFKLTAKRAAISLSPSFCFCVCRPVSNILVSGGYNLINFFPKSRPLLFFSGI